MQESGSKNLRHEAGLTYTFSALTGSVGHYLAVAGVSGKGEAVPGIRETVGS